MSPPSDALVKKRYFAINLMRFMGVAFLMAGFVLIAGRWDIAGQPTDRYLGIALVLIGAFDFAVFPLLLARRWRSPKEL
jgi:drug/metabolite transporter (DMT)-like permease